jgi:hypothetical protein
MYPRKASKMYLKRLKILPKNVHFLLNPGLGFKGFGVHFL